MLKTLRKRCDLVHLIIARNNFILFFMDANWNEYGINRRVYTELTIENLQKQLIIFVYDSVLKLPQYTWHVYLY